MRNIENAFLTAITILKFRQKLATRGLNRGPKRWCMPHCEHFAEATTHATPSCTLLNLCIGLDPTIPEVDLCDWTAS